MIRRFSSASAVGGALLREVNCALTSLRDADLSRATLAAHVHRRVGNNYESQDYRCPHAESI